MSSWSNWSNWNQPTTIETNLDPFTEKLSNLAASVDPKKDKYRFYHIFFSIGTDQTAKTAPPYIDKLDWDKIAALAPQMICKCSDQYVPYSIEGFEKLSEHMKNMGLTFSEDKATTSNADTTTTTATTTSTPATTATTPGSTTTNQGSTTTNQGSTTTNQDTTTTTPASTTTNQDTTTTTTTATDSTASNAFSWGNWGNLSSSSWNPGSSSTNSSNSSTGAKAKPTNSFGNFGGFGGSASTTSTLELLEEKYKKLKKQTEAIESKNKDLSKKYKELEENNNKIYETLLKKLKVEEVKQLSEKHFTEEEQELLHKLEQLESDFRRDPILKLRHLSQLNEDQLKYVIKEANDSSSEEKESSSEAKDSSSKKMESSSKKKESSSEKKDSLKIIIDVQLNSIKTLCQQTKLLMKNSKYLLDEVGKRQTQIPKS